MLQSILCMIVYRKMHPILWHILKKLVMSPTESSLHGAMPLPLLRLAARIMGH